MPTLTLDDVLALAGDLDDRPGFDVPRERFRRFLTDRVRDAGAVRELVEQCQHVPGTQHHRALQDLVVLLGRFLGFETTFGAYTPVAGTLSYHGQWRARHKAHVLLEVRNDHAQDADIETLRRSIAALAASVPAPSPMPAGLYVLPPLYARREQLEQAIHDARLDFKIGIVSLKTLVSLAELTSAGRLTQGDVIRLLESGMPVDFVAGLLERSASPRPVPSVAIDPDVEAAEPACWLATVASDYATPPEEVLEVVVGRRHVFGVTDEPAAGVQARPGDRVCFHIPGKGVVGHAKITAREDSGKGIRDAHRFRQLLRIEQLHLHLSAPVPLDAETELRMRTAAPSGFGPRAQALVRISRESYVMLTARHVDAPAGAEEPDATEPAIAEDSRSPE